MKKRLHLSFPVLLFFLLPALLAAQRPLTPPFLVNVPNGQLQFLPTVAANASGEFAVTWVQENGGQNFDTVRARRFSADGSPVTGEILVTDQAFFQHAATAVMEDGSFAVAFVGESGLTVRLYGPDGALVHETLVSAAGQHPAIAVRDDGAFILIWSRDGTVFSRILGGDGVPLGPERGIGAADLVESPGVVAEPDRGFVVVWSRVRPLPANPHFNNFTIFAQRLGPAGAPRGEQIVVRRESANGAAAPSIARDAGGNFLVVWDQYLGPGVWGILGRRYSPAGTPLSALLTLERSGDDVPRLTMDPAGNFVVTWMEYGTPGKVLAQRFTSGGAPFRPVFQVDTPPPGVTWAPDIASAANGNFIVVWGAGEDVYARLYRKR